MSILSPTRGPEGRGHHGDGMTRIDIPDFYVGDDFLDPVIAVLLALFGILVCIILILSYRG